MWNSFQQESHLVDHIKVAEPGKWHWGHRAALWVSQSSDSLQGQHRATSAFLDCRGFDATWHVTNQPLNSAGRISWASAGRWDQRMPWMVGRKLSWVCGVVLRVAQHCQKSATPHLPQLLQRPCGHLSKKSLARCGNVHSYWISMIPSAVQGNVNGWKEFFCRISQRTFSSWRTSPLAGDLTPASHCSNEAGSSFGWLLSGYVGFPVVSLPKAELLLHLPQ